MTKILHTRTYHKERGELVYPYIVYNNKNISLIYHNVNDGVVEKDTFKRLYDIIYYKNHVRNKIFIEVYRDNKFFVTHQYYYHKTRDWYNTKEFRFENPNMIDFAIRLKAELDCHEGIVEIICSDINTLLTTPYRW